VSAIVRGRSVKIEIKVGQDRLSEHQIKYGDAVTKAGGVYLVVKNFDEFINWYDSFVK
jgi:hypothetical protein